MEFQINMKDELFLPTVAGEDAIYALIRDSNDPLGEKYRTELNALWHVYRANAPKSFKDKLQIEFYSRLWEMYLTVGMDHLGFKFRSSPKDCGPDLVLEVDGKSVWIEAVAPSVGEIGKPNSVPDPVPIGGSADFPINQCLPELRTLDKWDARFF
jgi:hypothetical protein